MNKNNNEAGVQKLEFKVSELLSQLTLPEKISLCAGASLFKTRGVPRLGIGKMKLSDGPRGVAFHSVLRRCTAFPSGIAQAATWNPELMQQLGVALADECRSIGGRVILGPAINITRTPLNGRTFEYLSEDPYLNARLAVPMIQGIQSRGVAACAKHFAANNQEKDRIRITAKVSERALEEIYYPAFKAAVEQADVWSVMAAYNGVNEASCCDNAELLTKKLRKDYRFQGFVVSDWFAVRRTQSPESCVKAGLNLEMPGWGSKYSKRNLHKAFEEGKFTESELDNVVAPLLRVMLLTGHIDSDCRAVPEHKGARNTAEHQALALTIAEQSIVLLKNEHQLLPLKSELIKKIAVLGPHANRRHCYPLWGGSAGVWSPYEVTPLKGLKAENRGRFEFVAKAEDADAALVFVGLTHRPGVDSEGVDRADLSLTEKHRRLIEETVTKNPNTVVVLINGSPVEMPWLDKVPAVLECWYGGMESGRAIANVLYGEVNPSGKLPVSFPQKLEDSPAHRSARTYPGDTQTVHYDEDLLVGYRHFDRAEIEPLFPFGHGLSYSRFAYGEGQLNKAQLSSEDTLELSFTLTNIGEREGAEVVQLYIAREAAEADRPPQVLKAFRRIVLQPGESQQVTFTLPVSELAEFCETRRAWVLPPGNYTTRLGSSSRDIRQILSFCYH
ncbi:glycoside hydrolase family 3 C-terminal domain-containing protein [Spongiibacter sp. KMU-158]|uniref:Beta-D-glucoside glucohydrolase n=1 Tax=Spongiibacter pelagi TaxID=2760804 RepID=A0A927C2S4_9GAMM|nr:glycoside hydrolase family 3 C-terminal domain-containing protein [Spongiibacter pelagi]MBD2860250.1 glycoside hydrolase family 3 C-terminal domain-containing protein [Spongiibacter pelagi]